MAEEQVGTIIDGFERPIRRDDNGNSIVESGTPQPDRPLRTVAGFDSVAPADIRTGGDTGASGGGPGKRRGRPPGSRNGITRTDNSAGSTQKTTPNLANIESLFLSANFGLAALMHCPELEVDETEAKRFSDSLKELLVHYPTQFNPKAIAWANFGMTTLGIYGPRVVAIAKKKPTTGPRPVETIQRQPEPAAKSNPVAAESWGSHAPIEDGAY